jgi:hypothetical protein
MPLTQPDIIQSITNAVAVTDNSGSLTVDGTVAATQSGSWTVTANAGTGPFPVSDNAGSLTVDNAGTFAVQAAQSGSWTVTANAGTGPFAVSDNSGSLTVDAPVATPVYVRLSDGAAAITALPVTDNSGSLTVDGTVAATQSGSWTVTENAGTGPFPVSDNSGSLTVDAPVATPVYVRLSDGAAAITALPITDNSGSLTVDNGGTFAVQAAQSGTWTVQPGNTANTTAWKVDASSVAVPVTDNSGSLTVDGTVSTNIISSSSASVTSVADAATNQTLLASNASRKGFSIYNDSTSAVYVKYGATASSTSFTFKLDPYSYYEYAGHSIYTGQIDGIWATNSTGSARITEW